VNKQQHMSDIRKQGRQLLRATAQLISAETPSAMYDASNAIMHIYENIQCGIEGFEEQDLGYAPPHYNTRKMPPVEEIVALGDKLLAQFSSRKLKLRGRTIESQEIPKELHQLACDGCGDMLNVEGACPALDHDPTQDDDYRAEIQDAAL